ncbi:MAG: prepilin-type N-terminal cleavage/methylation domain-containing protein [Fretibacterium sp.]|nr:prepilin-type N-terminal cleavage/methylation domain-containing protein [Fretibacterium sp.]
MGIASSSAPGRRFIPRRAAFTLVEALIALAVLGLMGAMGATVAWGRRTGEREADRAMRWLYSFLARSDRTGMSFSLEVEPRRLTVTWKQTGEAEGLDASEGCSFQRRARTGPSSLYSPQWGTFTPALTLEVTGARGDAHYLILSGQGRVRTSAIPP